MERINQPEGELRGSVEEIVNGLKKITAPIGRGRPPSFYYGWVSVKWWESVKWTLDEHGWAIGYTKTPQPKATHE